MEQCMGNLLTKKDADCITSKFRSA